MILFPHLNITCFGSLFWGVLIWKAKAEKALEESGLPYTVSAAHLVSSCTVVVVNKFRTLLIIFLILDLPRGS